MLRDIYHRARSSDPAVAFAALCKLGWAYPVLPTVDSGWKDYLLGRGCLPAATNYCTNPKPVHMSNAIPAGWSLIASDNSTYTFADGSVYEGVVTKHVHILGGAGAYDYAGVSPKDGVDDECVPGDPITVSAVLGEMVLTGCTLVFTPVWFNGPDFVSAGPSYAIPVTSTFERKSYTWTTPATANKVFLLLAAGNNFHEGDVQEYSVCNISITKSSILTPYFDGDTPGCYWSGAANASASVRAESGLALPFAVGSSPLTVAVRVVPLWATTNIIDADFLAMRSAAIIGLFLQQLAGGNTWRAVTWDGVNADVAPVLDTTVVGETTVIVSRLVWESTLDCNVNGVDSAQATTGLVASPGVTQIVLAPNAYAYIGPVLVAPKNAPQAYVNTLQGNSGALYSDVMGMVELSRRSALQPFMIAPLQSDSVAYTVVQ